MLFNQMTPQFMHTYVQKMFGTIPNLHIIEPFPNLQRYSQIAATYMLSYFLGMLARYYPTYWVALMQGERGDILWPTLNRAQHLVERAFPELTIELITSVAADGL